MTAKMPSSFKPIEKKNADFPASFKPVEREKAPEMVAPKEKESFYTKATRAAAQPAQALAQVSPPGLAASALELFGRGEALAELEELEERLPDLKKKFPHLNWPEKIDREKYMQAVETASNTFPTVSNISRLIEETTGLPLAPKTSLDKGIRFFSEVASLKPGGAVDKIMSGLKGEIARRVLEESGIPEGPSDLLSLYYALRGKTPSLKKVPAQAKAEAEQVAKGVEAPVQPIEPPGGIAPGKILPESRGAYAEEEKILEKLHEIPEPPSVSIRPQAEPVSKPVPSLVGRVKGEEEIGDIISKEVFHSEAQAGREISKEIKDLRDAEQKIVRDKYRNAEEVTKSHDDVFPKLAKENEERISRLENLEKRSAAEEAVYQDALALKRMIGTTDGLIEANAGRLMKQADSFSSKVNYEQPYAGAKSAIKEMVHQINNSVIESLEAAGKSASTVRAADKYYSQFANRFMGDEISPFLQRKILNEEDLFRKSVSDEATYRSIKDALGSRKSDVVKKIDRELAHGRMKKYTKNPDAVGTEEYRKDLSNLQQLIGKDRASDVDYFLRKRAAEAERKARLAHKIKERAPSKVSPNKPTPISERLKKEPIPSTPEELRKEFNSVSQIRKLKRKMKDSGLTKEFDRLAEKKVEEIFKEGKFGEKKVTGSDLRKIIDDKHEILVELLGEEEVSALYKVAKEAEKAELTEELVMKIAKKIGKSVAGYVGLGKIVKLLP